MPSRGVRSSGEGSGASKRDTAGHGSAPHSAAPHGERMSPPTRVMYAIFNEGPLGKLLRYGPPSPWHRAGLLLLLVLFGGSMIRVMAHSAVAFWAGIGIWVAIVLIVPVGWGYAQYWNRRHPDLVSEERSKQTGS